MKVPLNKHITSTNEHRMCSSKLTGCVPHQNSQEHKALKKIQILDFSCHTNVNTGNALSLKYR